MATARLTFLYPHFYRYVRTRESAAQTTRQCRQCSNSRKAAFSICRNEQRFAQRHGKAVKPLSSQGESKRDTKASTGDDAVGSGKNIKHGGKKDPSKETDSNIKRSKSAEEPLSSPDKPQSTPGDLPASDRPLKSEDAVEKTSGQSKVDVAPPADGPLEKVMKMEPSADNFKLPHLHPPPFVHNFDTYTLVKEIETGGFTNEQAITAMKALRVLLAKNLEVAKENLVSKSDVENETYLFRAACSELQTEIQNMRKANEEKMRRDRTLLQHEVDILNQKLTQELLSLKDDLNGMFNDRKMEVKMEQRAMQSAIQELNYKITVALNSDAKSEVEGLRWILTRRSVLAIVFMALMVLSSLRYASYRAHEQEMEQKRREKLQDQEAAERKYYRNGGEGMADGETQTEGSEAEPQRRDLSAGTAAEALSAN